MTSSFISFLIPILASAQTKDAAAILNTATTSLKSIGSPLINIVSVIIGLIGIVMLVPCFARYLRNEPGAGEAFVKHAGGYLIAIILLKVFRMVALS